MADFDLVPVDHDPFGGADPSTLTPIGADPAARRAAQLGQIQQSLTPEWAKPWAGMTPEQEKAEATTLADPNAKPGKIGPGYLSDTTRAAMAAGDVASWVAPELKAAALAKPALGITLSATLPEKVLEKIKFERSVGEMVPEGPLAKGQSNYQFTTPSGQQVESYVNGRTHPDGLNDVGFTVNDRYGRKAGSPPRSDFMDILRGVRDHVSAYIENHLDNPQFNGVSFMPHGGTSADMEAKDAIYGKFAKAIADKYGLEYVPRDASTRTTTKTTHMIVKPGTWYSKDGPK